MGRGRGVGGEGEGRERENNTELNALCSSLRPIMSLSNSFYNSYDIWSIFRVFSHLFSCSQLLQRDTHSSEDHMSKRPCCTCHMLSGKM